MVLPNISIFVTVYGLLEHILHALLLDHYAL